MSKIELTDLHKQGIEEWGKDFGKSEVLQLYPKGSLGKISFASLAEQEYQSTEFWCAMEFLDDLEVPRGNEKGENYSIVGRLAWMSRNKVKEVAEQ